MVVYLRGHEGRGIGLRRQAAGLPAAGRRPRHRRRQPRPRPARRRPPLRHRDADAARPRRRVGAADDQQPGQDREPGGLRHPRRRAGPADAAARTTTTSPTSDQARPDGSRPARPGPTCRRASPTDRQAEHPEQASRHERSRSTHQQPVDASDLRVAVVAASWHTQVMDGLVAGAERALADYGVEDPEVVRVPGTFELPVVAAALARAGYDAVVALGVVDPRRHAALRLRLLGRHRRPDPGRAGPRGAGRLRRPHL